MALQPAHSTNSGPAGHLGRTEPRIWTPPLRELTPETSYGYDVVDFAEDVLGEPLDPWQEWAAIHVGELLEDGRPRFRNALLLIARQNGKTHLAKVFILYWMFVERVPLVLGTSTTLGYAKISWQQICADATTNPYLAAELGPKPIRATIGEECLTTKWGSEYRIAASNRRAGRSLTVHRLLLDELREHSTWDAWNASTRAMNAVRNGQVLAVTNQGDDSAVVLDALRGPAIAYAETGEGDYRTGIFEWSAPDGADPTNLDSLAMANPNLGRRIDVSALQGEAMRAKAAGGEELAGFRTEVLCARVHQLDPAIDPEAWTRCATATPVDLAAHRDRVAVGLDVSLDGRSAVLVAAADLDGVVHAEVVGVWTGDAVGLQLAADLPKVLARIRPRAFGWFPQGPAAAYTADLEAKNLTPKSTKVEAITGDMGAACMGFADLVNTERLSHPDDPLLNSHIEGSTKLWRGDRWVFRRRGATPVSGTYAAAAAAHLARTLPPPRPKLVVHSGS
jgi:hypothetical protein